MKLLETLTQTQILNLLNNQVEGIFKTIIQSTDDWFSQASKISQLYYLTHSAKKTIAPSYEGLIELSKVNPDIDPHALIGDMVRANYIDKWNKEYSTLHIDYNVLESYSRKEVVEGTKKDTDTLSKNSITTSEDTDKTTYNITTTNNDKEASKTTTSRNRDLDNDKYGFNSSSPVGTEGETEEETETTTGLADDNYSEGKIVKTGTETKDYGTNSTTTGTENNTYNNEYGETKEISGRQEAPQDLIKKELNLRKMNIFITMMMKDIDSIIVLSVYD